MFNLTCLLDLDEAMSLWDLTTNWKSILNMFFRPGFNGMSVRDTIFQIYYGKSCFFNKKYQTSEIFEFEFS